MCRNSLLSGERLNQGDSLINGTYRFTMQNDANLVLYDDDRPLWTSNTQGKATSCYLLMQRDGNLVLYDNSNRALWASGSNQGDGNYVCVLQSDRNVVIYKNPIWATGTNI